MDIYEFAIKMELDGKEYYERLARETKVTGLKNIFLMLAKDEEEHHHFIKNLKSKQDDGIRSSTLKNANNIFVQMIRDIEECCCDSALLDAYKHAWDIENKSIEVYSKQLSSSKDLREKKIYKILVEEEKKHRLIIENIIEFVSEPDKNRGVKTVNSDPEFARWE